MKAKKLFTLSVVRYVVIIALFVVVAVAGYYFLFSKPDLAGNTVADNAFGWKFPIVNFPITGSGDLAYSDIRDPGGIPQGLPVRLKIPVIGVDSAIEDALITPDGRMDVPQGSKNVAWFALGPHPGQVGSAVIGGHFGINNNIPFVFYKLDKMKVGDKAYIVDDKGETLAFVVRSIKLFNRNADATTVFTSDDGLAHLNIITCEGVWNQVNGTYPSRRVVFTDAIPAEGAAPVSMIPVFSRTLSIGSRGTDVVALQNILEKKGFLVMPQGVSKGLFGSLTRAAVARYQASVGLPSAGLFGVLTRAKLNSDLALNPVLPNAGPDMVSPEPSSATETVNPDHRGFFQMFIELVESLYATWQSILVTSVLLALILFMLFKIIRR